MDSLWRIGGATTGIIPIVTGEPGEAKLVGYVVKTDNVDPDADLVARLFAQAPEMLRVLHSAYRALSGVSMEETPKEVMKQIFDILAFITGREKANSWRALQQNLKPYRDFPFTFDNAGGNENYPEKISGCVVEEGAGLAIRISGYGTLTEGEEGSVLFLEKLEDRLRLVVWPDASKEDADIINLDEADITKQ